jgi:hypothetical protein
MLSRRAGRPLGRKPFSHAASRGRLSPPCLGRSAAERCPRYRLTRLYKTAWPSERPKPRESNPLTVPIARAGSSHRHYRTGRDARRRKMSHK